MGDEYNYVDEDYLYEDEDYIYAEESWSLADELASGALPQPSWGDNILDDGWDDYDMYQYFEDIEYGNDDFMDPEERLEDASQPGDKRKRVVPSSKGDKRRKLADPGHPPVLWMSMVYRLDYEEPTDVKTLQRYSLFPDWRERFRDSTGLYQAAPKSLNAIGLDKAAYVEGELGSADLEEEDWEDEDDEEEQDDDMNDDDMAGGIDPEVLKGILSARGIAGPDQDTFLQSLMQMMQGGGEAGDDLLENLTTTLLGRAAEGGSDSAMTQWLSQKGVDLVDEEQQDTEASTPTAATAAHDESNTNGSTQSDGKDQIDGRDNDDEHKGIAESSATPSGAENKVTSSRKRKNVSFAPVGNEDSIEAEDKHLTSYQPSKRTKVDNLSPATAKLKSVRSQAGKATGNITRTPIAASMEIPKDDPEPRVETVSSRKRKAVTQEPGPQDHKSKRQVRGGFAAPTASSARKVSDSSNKAASDPAKQSAEPLKKTTRSGRKRE